MPNHKFLTRYSAFAGGETVSQAMQASRLALGVMTLQVHEEVFLNHQHKAVMLLEC